MSATWSVANAVSPSGASLIVGLSAGMDRSKHDYIDYAAVVKSKVSVPSVVSRYLSTVKVVHNRIPCPIHNGTDRNLLLHQDHFYCFVCGEGGDVIRLVRHIFQCSFTDALKRLNMDYCLDLPLGTKPSDAERIRLKSSYSERLKKEHEEADKAERLYRNYLDRLELLRTVEMICEHEAPQTPWDEWEPDWCTAMRLRTELREEIDYGGF